MCEDACNEGIKMCNFPRGPAIFEQLTTHIHWYIATYEDYFENFKSISIKKLNE